jgi:hypothetical protein
MDDGNELTSLKDYPHPERRAMLLPFSLYWTDNTFHRNGLKEGGCPRHAHYTKGISGMKSSTLQLLEKLKYDVLDIYYIYSFFQ